MYGCIYKITNLINGKIYIGKTVKSIQERFRGHCRVSERPRTYTSYLYNAMNKYGVENFKVEEIERCSSEEELDVKERYWIKTLQSQDPSIGYNIQESGEGDAVRSNEFIPSAKMLEALERGRHLSSSPKQKEQLAKRRRGCNVSNETRDKLRRGSLDRVHIHKDGKNLNPKREFLQQYLDEGWELGRVKK